MMELILVTAGCFLAVSGFAVLVETPRKYILQAGFAGACGGWVYFFSMQNGLDAVPASFLSALVIALLAHIFARIFKAPVTVFLIAGVIALAIFIVDAVFRIRIRGKNKVDERA